MITTSLCPQCGTRIIISLVLIDNYTCYDLNCFADKTKLNRLIRMLHRYWRWKAEGEKKFKKEQYYYDNYHENVSYEKETNTYSYRMQIYSPFGDTWASGEFKIKGNAIEITEEHHMELRVTGGIIKNEKAS